ncbi:hypothetical protein A5819_003653 [Enterococcus sp. 7E2_DIV0204]|uniref:NAD(P)H oxidoreductase n=1 Tax=unclassified Enterococcus TaxID=2608891 RepID=UPI000B73032F|nr:MULTISPECIES: NAD(P)H oxidoreductase [unclassified Enterococcus]OTN83834.1 hypothetical protein A5819_003653 [Enterococcus sp. 7E2_DIV0204]OTP47524.1 hypothetical protein A5884_003495 [Enterococcus sp. 7D2_DIV0200]
MNVLTVVTHPRKNSLTYSAMKSFNEGLEYKGNIVEVLDLYDNDFDPVIREENEPIWESKKIITTPDVKIEMDRLDRNTGLCFVFPVWWYMPPAMLKGYIDKVWQYNYAYGQGRLAHERIQWIALAGSSKEKFQKRGYDKILERYLEVGLSEYTGISKCRISIFYDTLKNEGSSNMCEKICKESYNLGETFLKF